MAHWFFISKSIVGVALVSHLLVATAAADFDAGFRAWERGKHDEALGHFRAAAGRGDPRAQDHLGMMYEDGDGVERSDEMAVSWYRQAAEHGYAPAQFNLGRMYRNGKGVIASDGQAMAWYRRAAQQGLAVAQFFLGLMYDAGKGAAPNPQQAYMWFNLAARQGDRDAAFKRDRLADRLTAEERDAADQAALAYTRAEPPPPASRVGIQLAPRSSSGPGSSNASEPPASPSPAPDSPTAAGSEADATDRATPSTLRASTLTPSGTVSPGTGEAPTARVETRAGNSARAESANEPTNQRRESSELAAVETRRVPPVAQPAPPRRPVTGAQTGSETTVVSTASAPAPAGSTGAPVIDRTDIRRAQRLLRDLGYLDTLPDGVQGASTLSAVEAFQRAEGLAVDGQITPRLIDRMREAQSPIGVSASSERPAVESSATPVASSSPSGDSAAPIAADAKARLAAIQRELARLDYDPGPADGLMGTQTRNAIEAFQRIIGEPVTGAASVELLDTLRATQIEIVDSPSQPVSPVAGPADTDARDGARDGAIVTSAAEDVPAAGESAAGDGVAGGVAGGVRSASTPSGPDLVRAIQIALNERGFKVGPADGVVGSRTRLAAQEFRRAVGLPASDALTPALLARLEAPDVATAPSTLANRGSNPPSRAATSANAPSPRGDPMVFETQLLLSQFGYNVGPLDGELGSRTVSAAKAFQADRGQRPDGIIGGVLLDALKVAAAAGFVSRDLTRAVQRDLNRLGYRAGEEDGLGGPTTDAAVRRFQRDAGLVTTGRIDADLASRLRLLAGAQ
ncbi:MAG: peptidoglycan-binding protein [Pseudomonadota bacterium]